jgi:hypothetical protein
VNLYGFVANNSSCTIDKNGLQIVGGGWETLIPPGPWFPPQPSPEQLAFDAWVAKEEAAGEWWKGTIPKCPCKLEKKETQHEMTICKPVDSIFPYSGEVNVQKITWITTQWVIPANYRDGDFSAKDWSTPSAPISPFVERFHPGAAMELRSKARNGHSNQCTYDKDGKLITEPPSMGTVDRGPSGTPTHWGVDVKPVIKAAERDGAWNDQVGPDILRGRIDSKQAGQNLQRYWKVRPCYHQDCPKNP